MAKKTNEFKPVFDVENLKVVKSVEKDINFWPFEKNPVLYCLFIEMKELEHKVFLVKELTSGNEYYLPAHNKISEAIKEAEDKYYLKITFKGSTKFDGGRKTYNSYDIDFLEKKD